MNVFNACLWLFKKLPSEYFTVEYSTDWINRGLLVPQLVDNSMANVEDLSTALTENHLTNQEMNNTFHRQWSAVINKSEGQLRFEQFLHYLSTYGAAELDLHIDEYLPAEVSKLIPWENLQQLELIDRLTAMSKLQDMLESGVAMDKRTIDSILCLLDEYKMTVDQNSVANRDLRVAIAVANGTTEFDSPITALQAIIYSITGSAQLIKDSANCSSIQAGTDTEYAVSILRNPAQQRQLAKIFYRYKRLFLALKHSDDRLRLPINSIRRLAVKLHEPASSPEYLLTKIRSGTYEPTELEGLNVWNKVKLYNKLSYYSRVNEIGLDYYRIRNGKVFIKAIEPLTKAELDNIEQARSLLFSSLQQHWSNHSYLLPKDLDLAVPDSLNAFMGDVPNYSSLAIKDSNTVFGISWFSGKNGCNIDFDLSLLTDKDKYGWNGLNRSFGSKLLYSGDRTFSYTDHRVSEAFLCSNTGEDYLVDCCLYNTPASDSNGFNVYFAVGDINLPDLEETIIDPNKVIKQLTISTMPSQHVVLGVLTNNTDGSEFQLVNWSAGSARVSMVGKLTQTLLKVVKLQASTALRWSAIVKTAEPITAKWIDEETGEWNSEEMIPEGAVDLRQYSRSELIKAVENEQ